ncbi:hypothetical protein Q4555_07160 [Octadecabacter sp. 1_MG-2023]|uniref:hypothetical protein n=1 Tax=unclassified Octadecabacter TaxID=196158 RepID=UPI001C08C13C|nr:MULTISPECIES: hypothetical protein [unclassified Octadecabacter]MBU2994269.1 hypothetical protein [Octadecabacter sp. B2R22]MDO6734442.1 hypothetical protein [Octadecabacter sp. 1_MG-2023]
MALGIANNLTTERAPMVLGMIALAVLAAGAFLQTYGLGAGLLETFSLGATTIFGLMAKIAGGVGFAALGMFVLHSRPVDGPVEPQDAIPVAPEPIQTYEAVEPDDTPTTPRKALGLRKILIVIVGALFLLGLASALPDFMGTGATGLNPA